MTVKTKPQLKNKLIVLTLVGEKLSGKEVTANYLVKKHGFKQYRFSKILDDILKELSLPVSRVNEFNLVGALRERFGGGVLAEAIKTKIISSKKTKVVIDGLRHPAELESLKLLPGFKLVYITAPLDIRYQRALKRGEKAGESKFSLADFKAEEKLSTEQYINKMGRRAHIKLVNEVGLNELYKQIEAKIIKA